MSVRKQRNKPPVSAFTLAEIIVVVTLLAILSTIGFLSLSGYRQDAREAVTKTNVRSVYAAIASESATTGNSARYYVVHDSSYTLSGSPVVVFDGISVPLAWGDWNASWTNYSAGNPDYVKLKMDKLKFKVSDTGFSFFERVFATDATDPNFLLVGAADLLTSSGAVKTRVRSVAQVAGVLDTWTAVVVGDFPTSLQGSVVWLVRDLTNPSSTWALVDGAKTGAAPGCDTAIVSGYTVPTLTSGQYSNVLKTTANGSVSATAFCSFWTVSLSSESVSCDSGYVPSDLSCIADVCGSTIPSNATSNATSQSVSGTWHHSATAGQCTFACAANHTWDSASSSCKASCQLPIAETWSGQTYAVSTATLVNGQTSSVPASSTFWTSPANGTLSATFAYSCSDGTLTKSVTVWTASCQSNYTWNSSWSTPTCTGNSQTFFCSAKPANSVWNTVLSYSQTWNGSAWLPADSATSYNASASPTECRYKCATWYGWDWSICQASVAGSCGTANKTYAYVASSYGSDTYCAVGTASTSPAFPSAGASVTWTCGGLYGWLPSWTCTAVHTAAANCSTTNQTVSGRTYSVPAFNHGTTASSTVTVGISNGTSTFQQAFSCSNGTISTSGAESNTANSCNASYSWNGSACADLTAPTISNVSASSPACNVVRITINGATDAIGLAGSPYSFNGGVSWQAGNTMDYSTMSQTLAANQIQVRDAAGNAYSYSTSVTWTAESCGFAFTPTISSNTQNYDLKSAAIAAGWNQVKPLYATVTVGAWVTVYWSAPSVPAFSAWSLPAGSIVAIVNNGNIYGAGGKWGNGNGYDGTNGGDAISLSSGVTLNITNAGNVFWWGGGGGGWAVRTSTNVLAWGGGGGGGQWFAGGAAWAGWTAYAGAQYPYWYPGTAGTVSSVWTGGNPGNSGYYPNQWSGGYCIAGVGWNGGGWWTAGGTGGIGSGGYCPNYSAGVGWAGGYAIRLNWASINWVSWNNANQVKGSVN